MTKYRRKTEPVEAFQMTPEARSDWTKWPKWLLEHVVHSRRARPSWPYCTLLLIEHSGGLHIEYRGAGIEYAVEDGDYLVHYGAHLDLRGAHEFEANFEKVEEDE